MLGEPFRNPGDPQSVRADSRARLGVSRVVGAAALAGFAQFAVDMPNGHFGPADRMTAAGAAFTAVELVLAGTAAVGLLGHRRWAPAAAIAALALVVGAFLGALAANPVIVGALVLWCLLLAVAFLVPPPLPAMHSARAALTDDPLDRWLAKNGAAARHLTAISVVLAVAVVGYRIGESWVPSAICLALASAVTAYTARFLSRLLRQGSKAPLLATVLLAIALAVAGNPTAALAWLAGFQAVVLALLVARTQVYSEVLEHFVSRPAQLVLVSFVTLIAFGALLLSLPAASAGPRPVAPVDAVFTATSAACVTGLIVLDTPNDFSVAGQAVILVLIQAGGLNIMVLSAFAALLLGQGMGLRGERAVGEVLDLHPARSPRRLVRFIVLGTLSLEAVAAVVLGLAFAHRGEAPLAAAWRGAFTSVSAFCNAGFALQSDSLVGYADSPLVLLTVAALVTLGGIGFAVLLFGWLRIGRHRHLGFATQARVVVAASLALTSAGWLAYAVLEWNRSLAGLTPGQAGVNALFQSVTLRTAGFNSVPFDRLGAATILMMLVFMFIGASPGGTGGGIKTTTTVILLASVAAVARGETRATVFGRTVPLETVFRSAAVAALGAFTVLGAGFVLLATQSGAFQSLLFETVSAFGTVGLSLGATAQLDTLGKLVIAAVMLVGRVGPLSLALLFGRRGGGRVRYPEARLMVG